MIDFDRATEPTKIERREEAFLRHCLVQLHGEVYKREHHLASLKRRISAEASCIRTLRGKMRNGKQVRLPQLLLVDDDSLLRLSMAAALGEIGFSVRSAQDGLSALEEIRSDIPDIVLSDLNMPRMSGFEILRIVRRDFPSIRLIAMSGAFSGDEVPFGVAADSFYQKGSSLHCLLRIIQRFNQPRLLPVQQEHPGPSSESSVTSTTLPETPAFRSIAPIVATPSNNLLAVPSVSSEKHIARIAGVRFTMRSPNL